MKREANVAYGTFDMIHKQDVMVVIGQIKDLGRKFPRAWFFDIMHTPNQLPEAMRMRDNILHALRSQHPDLPEADIVVSLNVPGSQRLRARNEMFWRIHEGQAKEVKLMGMDEREYRADA